MSDAPRNPSEEPSKAVPDAAVDADAALREYRFFHHGVIVTLVLSCALAFTLNLVDPDLWGHVKYAQEVIADGRLPTTATHTYTTPDHRWINHENLAELAFAWGYDHVGVVGMLVGKCVLGMVMLLLMVIAARRLGIGTLTCWAVMLLVAINLSAFFPMRPQIFSFFFCAVMLFLLDRAFDGWPTRTRPRFGWLWCIPLVMAIWANTHGGFVAGLCIFAAYMAGRSVEMLLRYGWGSWTSIGQMALPVVAAAVATLINPYGLQLPLWLVESLGHPRPEITDWAAPKMSDPIFLPFVLLIAIAALSVALNRRRRDWTQIVVMSLVAWQAAMHVRHIAFFAVLCGFWLPGPIGGLISRMRESTPRGMPDVVLAPWLRRAMLALLALVVVLQTTALSTRVTRFPVHRHMYPVDAMAFLTKHDLRGRMVASFNWAQYTIAVLSPNVSVQFDGRFRTCYPQQMVDMHFDFLVGEHGGHRHRSENSGPIDPQAVLEYGDPNLVLVERRYEHAEQVMQQAAETGEWVLLYQDGIAQLYGRYDQFGDPNSADYFPPADRIIDSDTPQGYVTWPALPDSVD